MLKGYLTLELTHSKIRYIFLTRDQHNYNIVKSGIVSQGLNIHAPGELTRSLQELIQREEIKPTRMFVTVCLQENIIRQVDIPRMGAGKMEQEIIEEIKKSPAFNQKKFDYIFDVTYADNNQGNLIFAAVEQSVLDYVLSECRFLGIPFGHLEIAPLNLKEILPLIEPDTENHTVLFVNDHVSYLMASSGGQWRFISRSTIGIEHLYPLMNDKINHTYFINLAGDLKRVISTFVSQQKIEKIEKLWIIWDQQGAANLASALAEKLNLNIQVLNLERLSNVRLGVEAKGANPMDLICVLPAVVFLERMKEQFSLTHFFRAQQYKLYLLKLFVVSVMVLGTIGFTLGVKSREYYLEQRKLNIETEGFNSAIEHFKSAKEQIYRRKDHYMDVRQGLLNRLKQINGFNQSMWPQALAMFIKEMPPQMALNSFKYNASGHISFSGEALDVKDVTELVNRLERSAIFEQGLIDSFTQKVVGTRKVYVFRIIARLKTESSVNNP